MGRRVLWLVLSMIFVAMGLLMALPEGTASVEAVTPPVAGTMAKPSDLLIFLPWRSGLESHGLGCYYGASTDKCAHVGNDRFAIDFNPTVQRQEILAVAPGRVMDTAHAVGYGDTVVIRHTYASTSNIFFSQYSHMSSVAVAIGDEITPATFGRSLGTEGEDGCPSCGPHDHFALYACPLGYDYTTLYNLRDQCTPVVPEPFVGQHVYEGLGWWMQLAWRGHSHTIMSLRPSIYPTNPSVPGGWWDGQASGNDLVVNRGQAVRYAVHFEDTEGVAEVRLTAGYSGWSRDAALTGLDESSVWRIVARCDPRVANSPCAGGTWTYLWYPFENRGNSLMQHFFQSDQSLLHVEWFPDKLLPPVAGQQVCISFDVFDVNGLPKYAPQGTHCATTSAMAQTVAPMSDDVPRRIVMGSAESTTDSATFVSDLTLPDGSVVAPG